MHVCVGGWVGYMHVSLAQLFLLSRPPFTHRNLPRSLVIGLSVVVVVYLLVNMSLFVSLSYEEISNAEAVALVRGIYKQELYVLLEHCTNVC